MNIKGQQEIVSVVLISGILIGMVGSVYLWGVPLIEKNKDISVLENAEDFMRNLDAKIKFVANNGGRDQLEVNVPGVLKFDPLSKTIELSVETQGTIYSEGADIPLGKNPLCTSSSGFFGINDPDTLCVRSISIGESSFLTIYTLKYITLEDNSTLRKFLVDLDGNSAVANEGSVITFENTGTQTTPGVDRTLIRTFVQIKIV